MAEPTDGRRYRPTIDSDRARRYAEELVVRSLDRPHRAVLYTYAGTGGAQERVVALRRRTRHVHGADTGEPTGGVRVAVGIRADGEIVAERSSDLRPGWTAQSVARAILRLERAACDAATLRDARGFYDEPPGRATSP